MNTTNEDGSTIINATGTAWDPTSHCIVKEDWTETMKTWLTRNALYEQCANLLWELDRVCEGDYP